MRSASDWRLTLMQTAFRPAMGTSDEIEWGDYIERWVRAAQRDAIEAVACSIEGDRSLMGVRNQLAERVRAMAPSEGK